MKSGKVVWWLESVSGLLLQVAAHAQQQQHVHAQQVEGEQQRRALAGAEGRSQHPHHPRAAAPRLHGGERERRNDDEGVDKPRPDKGGLIKEAYATDGSVWGLDEDGGVRVFVLLRRPPLSLAVADNHTNTQTSAVTGSHQNQRASGSG